MMMVRELNRNLRLIPFLIAASITYFLSEANIMQRFTPRSMCMFMNQKLIMLHAVSDFSIFSAYVGIGVVLFGLYKALESKGLPFTGFFWQFAAFIFFCGLTHAISVLNLYITFYWLDGAVKLVTAWFSILVCLALIRDYKKIKNLPTPHEFQELTKKLNDVLEEIQQIKSKC